MKTYSCGLNWFGPFTNIQQVKEWEDSNGNDTYLYLNRGKKKYAKKYVHLMAGQGTGQCPTHFSQATGETRLFRRTLTCPLYREWRKGRFRELLKAALLLL